MAIVAGLPGAGEVAAQGTRDYASAGDANLIDITTLAQLDAIRYDLDGNGRQDSVSDADWAKYQAAFPNAIAGMGCVPSCAGYELLNSLDFDENGDGALGPRGDPTYWNEGKGWHPIGAPPDFNANMEWCGDNTTYCYTADFDGNGHTISNLYINRAITNNWDFSFVGLFGTAYNNTFRDVGLVNPYISIMRSGTSGPSSAERYTSVGALVGQIGGSAARISGSWVDGGGITFTQSNARGNSKPTVGCLAGRVVADASVISSGATCAVNLSMAALDHQPGSKDTNEGRAGGLVGYIVFRTNNQIIASYARGNVACRNTGAQVCGGLVGQISYGNVTSSYATGNVSNEFAGDAIFYGNVGVGGLLGLMGAGSITESYSAGRITRNNIPLNTKAHGLVGGFQAGTPSETASTSYWDSATSGITNAHAPTRRGNPKTTSELQTLTGYSGIYADWEQNLDGEAGDERPWDFGTSADYPILTWGHSARSIELQRAPQPTATQYELPTETAPDPEPEEYVAPPIVYNLNIRFNVKGLTLDEGESATYQVRMSQSPVGHPARVAITSNNPDVTVSPTELTFSSANYREWQTVSVSVARDPNDTDESANIAHRGPNLSYGSILVTVNDIWPGTTTETVNGHTLTLHHTANAPAGVTITAPATLDADAAVTVSAAPSHTPMSAPGYGLGQSDAAQMLASIRVVNAPSDGLTICLAAPAALVTEAGERPLALLRYADGVWQPVANTERREGATGTTLLCAAGVTEYGVFAAAYAIPDALGVASNLAAITGGAGTVILTWTPAANATVHFVFAIKKTDAEARNYNNLAAWGFTDRANAHTITDLEPGAPYYFTIIGGRARPNGTHEWAAWTPLLTVTPD